MTRPKWLVPVLVISLGLAIGAGVGYPLGSQSRNDDVAAAKKSVTTQKLEKAKVQAKLSAYEARENELRLREARAPQLPKGSFPKGFPKVVNASTVPEIVRSGTYDGMKQVVAVAPGVWTALPDGSDIADAVASGSLDGFCASIKAYERMYTPGVQHSGSCV
ncbi:MAG: hypothetical protein ABIR57_01070 [Aeromicrobium sp.]